MEPVEVNGVFPRREVPVDVIKNTFFSICEENDIFGVQMVFQDYGKRLAISFILVCGSDRVVCVVEFKPDVPVADECLLVLLPAFAACKPGFTLFRDQHGINGNIKDFGTVCFELKWTQDPFIDIPPPVVIMEHILAACFLRFSGCKAFS